jgi:SPW repeat-containing protein
VRTNRQESPLMIYVEALNVVLAIWLIASPYLLGDSLWKANRLTAGIFGACILGWAITRMAMPQPKLWWLSFGNVIFGIWVAISPFVFGYYHDSSAMIASVVTGIVVALIAATGFLRSRESPKPALAA